VVYFIIRKMDFLTVINSTYRIVREYGFVANSVNCISLYIAYTRPNLRNLGIQTFVLMNVPSVLNYLSNIKIPHKYKKYVDKVPLTEMKTITNFITYGVLVKNFTELQKTISQMPPPLSLISSVCDMFISLQLSFMKTSLIFSCVIVGTTTIVNKYLKKHLDNMISTYVPNYHKIVSILNHIPAEAIENSIKNISNGQSLDIFIDTPNGEAIKIISIPRKISITEDKLEELFPKRCPVDHNYDLNELQFEQKTCSICGDAFVDSEKLLRVLKCNHAYHCGCIDGWFFGGHLECPTCRKAIM
jgi:hypothetical protein